MMKLDKLQIHGHDQVYGQGADWYERYNKLLKIVEIIINRDTRLEDAVVVANILRET